LSQLLNPIGNSPLGYLVV